MKRLLLVVVCFLLLMSGCANTLLPVYEKTDEDGMSVFIDGVRYKFLPMLKWNVPSIFFTSTWEAEVIGYAGSKDIRLFEVYGDTDRNFVNVFINGHYECFLYRADTVFPEPSTDSVSELEWLDYKSGKAEEMYSNIIDDKNIIKQLFDLLETNETESEIELIERNDEKIIIFINCIASDLPGASYSLSIGTINGKIVCGSRAEKKFVEIPIELLEKIAGKSLKGLIY